MQAPPASSTDIRRQIDAEITRFLDAVLARGEPEIAPLVEQIRRMVNAGGKRLRPVFCYWGHVAAPATPDDRIVRAAAALELLHTFAIVHDDVMDSSPVRRGLPSAHRAFAEAAAQPPGRGDPFAFGVSAAILTGDLALVLADRMLASAGFGPERLGGATRRFDEMRVQAITGQYLDLLASRQSVADENLARRVARLKSGGYTVRYPLAIGAELGGASSRVHAALEAYGVPLGEAFQLRDDVLGVFGDPASTGKDRDSDLREGKQTLLIAKARTLSTQAERRFLDDRLGRPDMTASEAERIRDIVRSSGALDATIALIEQLRGSALSALDRGILPSAAVTSLDQLATLVTSRNA